MSKPDLLHLQNWLHSFITTRGNLRQKAYFTQAQHQLVPEQVVANRRGVGPYDRLRIYANGYIARLKECLCADYPLLRQFMTEPVFDHFATAYLVYKKPNSYTLFDLGKDFPQFLLDTQPQEAQENNPAFALPYALAVYERAFLKVYRAKGLEQQVGNTPTDTFSFLGMTMLQAAPSLECIEVDFPILEVTAALRQKEAPAIPEPQKTYLAISRKNYRMFTNTLEPWQYYFLKATTKPISSHQAATISAEKSGKPVEEILAELLFFLPVAYDNWWLNSLS